MVQNSNHELGRGRKCDAYQIYLGIKKCIFRHNKLQANNRDPNLDIQEITKKILWASEIIPFCRIWKSTGCPFPAFIWASGPFLFASDAKHESEHTVNSTILWSSFRWLLLLSWAMNYHSHRQLSTGILLAMGGLSCVKFWARKPRKEGEGGGINTLCTSSHRDVPLTRDRTRDRTLKSPR